MSSASDRERRDESAVETVLALALGLVTFIGLALVGWLVDKLLDAVVGVSMAPIAQPLLVSAAVVSVGVVVRHLLLMRRRG